MKKYLLLIFIIINIFSVNLINAEELLVSKIFKLEVYKKNEINGIYEYLQYGSAVLLDNNTVITNAHVVLDDEDVPTGNYNLCVSDTFDLEPKCKTSMKLIKYDKTNDLAILKPVENISFNNPIQFSDKKLNLGDNVTVYGYPANGGNTITLTVGKISGVENEIYKIDANIDAGNSGGGAFDKDGKLIGIPYIASIGYSTLGYMIPISKIEDFLSDKGSITKYGKIDNDFNKFIKNCNNILLNQKINNPYFDFNNFKQKNFILKSANESNLNILNSEYLFQSKTKKTQIIINTKQSFGKKYYTPKVDISSIKEYYALVKEKNNIILGGKKISKLLLISGLKKNNGIVDKNFFYLHIYMDGIYYGINSSNYESEKKFINSALSLFIKDFKIKDNISLNNKSIYNFPSGSFTIIDNMFLEENFSYINFFFDSNMAQEGNVYIEKTYYDKGKYSMDNYTFEEWLKNNVIYNYGDSKNEIKKNNFGIYYFNEVYENKKTGEVNYKSEFYNIIDNNVYILTILFKINKKDSELEKKYYQFIDTVNLSGNFPFKSANIGEIKESK